MRVVGFIDWRVLLAVALLLALAMILLYRLLNRDETIRRTRYGLFIERDKFEPEEQPWPKIEQTKEQRTLENWPDKGDK